MARRGLRRGKRRVQPTAAGWRCTARIGPSSACATRTVTSDAQSSSSTKACRSMMTREATRKRSRLVGQIGTTCEAPLRSSELPSDLRLRQRHLLHPPTRSASGRSSPQINAVSRSAGFRIPQLAGSVGPPLPDQQPSGGALERIGRVEAAHAEIFGKGADQIGPPSNPDHLNVIAFTACLIFEMITSASSVPWVPLNPFIAATIPTISRLTSRIRPTYSTVPWPNEDYR